MRFRFAVTILTLIIAAPGSGSQGRTWRTVVQVIDGDTIVLDGLERVRLIGVDAPEKGDPLEPVATEFTKKLALAKRVRLELDRDPTDDYGRTLAYVYLEDGTMLNLEIVRQGMSSVYDKYPFRHVTKFRSAEREARKHRNGLWASGRWAGLAAAEPSAKSAEDEVIVYVTRTGTKYHRAGCRYLSKSAIPMALSQASARYNPCSVSRPPVP